MANMEKHYMILLTADEQQLLKNYLTNPQVTNKTVLRHKPFALLRQKPYPVLDILLLQPPHSLVHIKWAIIKTFEDFLKHMVKTGITTNFLKFLIRIPEDILNEALQGELREQFKQCLHNTNLNDEFFLSLMARKEKQLMLDILEYLKETQWQFFTKPLGSKEFVLHQALKNQNHFLNALITESSDFSLVEDATLRNNLIVLKLVHELSMTYQRLEQLPNIEQLLESMDLESVDEDLKQVYLYFYKDFKRIAILMSYIQKFPDMFSNITVEEMLNASTPLSIINKHKLLATYDEAKAFIESYYMWQANTPSIALKENELETLCYYFILSTIYDIVTLSATTAVEEMYTQKIQFLNSLLRQVKKFDLLCQILEDILKFIYLRWEHMNSDTPSGHTPGGTNNSSSCTDDDIVQDSSAKNQNTKVKKALLKYTKTGFICKSKSFSTIFNFLKMFVTRKLHSADYKQSTTEVKQRFQCIVDNISNLLWKYGFFEKMEQTQRQALQNLPNIYVDPDCLINFVHFHMDSLEHGSSDDDELLHVNHQSWLSRRKAANKRRRATFSGSSVTREQAKLSLHQCRARANALANSVAAEEPLKRLSESKVSHLPMAREAEEEEEKSIVPKLLSSPERLAVLALSMKQFNEAKQIIENFNLQNSQLSLELQYMEQQQQVKQKLSTIYDKYQQQERQSRNANEPLATVEQIRNVVAKGFEVSKIISVIDQFAQMQHIKQPESFKDLIHKHKANPQYRFLTQFEEANLNAVNICDLILSLPFNRDITTSILMVIKRHQAIQSTFNEFENVEKSQLPPNIGPLHFLENLADCMRIQSDKSIKDLLCDNIYTLKPHKLTDELEKERIFREVFYKSPAELSRYEDLKSLIPEFQALKSKYNYYQRFCNYMFHLTKLVHLRDPNCEYHTEELLKIDPCDVIGDLIFTCNMTPLEIEANVVSLNLDLVHVIALNICPEIVGKSSKKYSLTPQKEATVFSYISNYNHLLVHLLRGITTPSNFSKDTDNDHINPIYLERLLQMPEIEKLATLYGGNKMIAVLKSDHISEKLLDKSVTKMEQLQILQFEMGVQEAKPLRLKRMDCLIIDIIREDPKKIYLASNINNIALRAKLIYENFTKIATTRMAKELIESTLQHRHALQKIPLELRQQLEVILADITIYAKVSEVMQFETWPQAYDFGLKTPTTIFERLLQLHLYKLCYEWCNVVKLSENFRPQRKQIFNILLEALMDMGEEELSPNLELNAYEYLLKILETFHPDDCKSFLEWNKEKFGCMALLKYSIEYLERFAGIGEENNFRNYRISILIFEHLSLSQRNLFKSLLKYPLLIIEQLIMNAKFEVLTKVLLAIRTELDRMDSKPNESKKLCSFCFDKDGYIYDIHAKTPNSPHKVRFQLGLHDNSNASAFILLNFNLYQKDHIITNDCIDLLLRIYATKALDYQISDTNSTSEPCSQSTCDMQQSLDSLCGAFQMPSQAPSRSEWVRDEDASHCMCCRRAAFTMLMRRHHCRRCGRVVCFACSTYRMRIPELYEDVEVRICNDCQQLCEDYNQRKANRDSQSAQPENLDDMPVRLRQKSEDRFKWKLSGNITHDKLLREEFCYEHAPSVALCLSILEYHLSNQKCVDLLLFHCRKLEKLIIPNPEVDFELVAKMMNCLALAAKVRGAPPEVEAIREHSEIIISVVQNGCESLIPPDPFNNHGLRKLADSLVQAEKWDLALELHLKFGYPTAGVMASHGLSCLRAGCFDTAREKFYHCMARLTNESANTSISKIIFSPILNNASNDNVDSVLGLAKDHDIPMVKRPHNGPPLLQEILKLIELLPFKKPQPETLQRASIIRNSNTSLASLLSRRKEPYVKRMHEPAINILNTLANLKRISKGQYPVNSNTASSNNNDPPIKRRQLFRKTQGFEECLYYVLTYGSHTDVIQFLMKHQDIVAALKYYLLQKLDADIFINHVFLELLKVGRVSELIKHLLDFDNRLLIWRATLLQTCRFLETQNYLNSLYQLQVLLNDTVRASMTCVKFYTMNCETFQQQHLNAHHLHNARLHLQSELENAQWETINFNTPPPSTKSQKTTNRRSSTSSSTSSKSGGNFLLQLDGRTLNAHINTIVNQLEVAKFLAKCEVDNSGEDVLLTEKILKQIRIESTKSLPTLFDKAPEKIQLCILILLCGKNIEEGFGLAYRIIQHYKLPPMKIYASTAKYLARNQRLAEVDKLISCITSNNGTNTRDIDEILSVAINSAVNNHEPQVRTALDSLAKKIHSIELRISSHIFIGQLKSAYLLANTYERLGDIRKILRQAEATNQVHIKRLCEKKLQMSSSSTTSQTTK